MVKLKTNDRYCSVENKFLE